MSVQSNPYLLNVYSSEDNSVVVSSLLRDINESLYIMKQILGEVGTTSDTVQQRKKFMSHKSQVHKKIEKARSLLSDTSNPQPQLLSELSQCVTEQRNQIQIARKRFVIKAYKPKIPRKIISEEEQPLLSNNSNNSLQLTQITNKEIVSFNNSELLTDTEESVDYMLDLLKDTNSIVTQLDDIVTSQDDDINVLENDVIEIYDNAKDAESYLLKAKQYANSSHKQKCCIFSVVTVMFIILCVFAWKMN